MFNTESSESDRMNHSVRSNYSVRSMTIPPPTRTVPLINLEPTMLLYCLFLGIFFSISAPFLYFKVCMMHYYGTRADLEHFCKSLGHMTVLGNESMPAEAIPVQSETSHYSEYIQIASSIPAIFATLFAGAWSDKHGRKPPLVVATFSTFLNAAIYTYSATYVTSPNWLLLIGNFVCGAAGGFVVVFQLIFSAVRDSYPEPRAFTVHLGVFMGLGWFGSVLGALLGGYMIERTGYRWVMLVSLISVFVMFLHTVFVVKETLPQDEEKYEPIGNYKDESTSCCLSFWKSLGVAQAVWTLTQPREGKKRFHILLGLFGFFIMCICDIGLLGSNLLLLYFKLPPLLWDASLYMYYNAFVTALGSVGVPLCTWILKRLHFRDSAVTIVGLVTSSILLGGLCMVRTTLQVFLVSSLSFVSKLIYSGFRAHLVMLVPEAETGRLFSLVALVETFGPLVGSLLFNNIYPLTLRHFPWFVFALGAGLMALDAIIMLYAHFDTRRLDRLRESNDGLADSERKPLLNGNDYAVNS